ncbi:MAG: cyclic nucleotide-binding domain-containing protein [Alphaproteobacteria bacterium]|nr:cyclic nucleotide-binding domain-containing protein [Alphaproteobacteria bacterium]
MSDAHRDPRDAARVLGQLPGLAAVDELSLMALAEHFEQTTFRDGELICEEGAPAETLYVLAEGTVEVRKRSLSGRQHTVAELTGPCLFGHVGVLALTERTASIRSAGSTRILHMSARRARVIMRTGQFSVASPFRRALIVAMCQQLASATSAVASLAVDANVAEPAPSSDGADEPTEAEQSLPPDAEERLLKGLSNI